VALSPAIVALERPASAAPAPTRQPAAESHKRAFVEGRPATATSERQSEPPLPSQPAPVDVVIGRIEVRTEPPAAPPVARTPAGLAHVPSLGDYLARLAPVRSGR